MTLADTHSVSGRVVDRQGQPVAGAELIQSGDGPERTITRSGADGRFRLGGYDDGTALISARAPGFRYGGRVVVPGENVIVLTRIGERPEKAMPSLPPPIERAEMRVIARKLLASGLDDPQAIGRAREQALFNLMFVDPIEARDRYSKLDGLGSPGVLRILVPALYLKDPEAAMTLLSAIKEPEKQAEGYLAIYDSLRMGPDPRKPPIVERLSILANTRREGPDGLWILGETAERLVEVGQVEKARLLFAEGLKVAVPLAANDARRIRFAINLGRLEPEMAFGLLREIPNKPERVTALYNLASRIAESRPESFDLLAKALDADGWNGPSYVEVARMARTAPEHAARLVTSEPRKNMGAVKRLALALGVANASREDAERHFHEAIEELEGPQEPGTLQLNYTDLNLVEEINPELVPEFLWFAASRRGEEFQTQLPELRDNMEARFIAAVSRYDREVAMALLAPLLERAKALTPEGCAALRGDFFQAVAQLEPSTILTWVDSLPTTNTRPGMTSARDSAAFAVATFLGRWGLGIRPRLLPSMITTYDQIRQRDTLR